MVLFSNVLSLLYLCILFPISQTNNYIHKKVPVSGTYSIDLSISPGKWYILLDTVNEQFLLYQPKDSDDGDYKWPEHLINQTESIVEQGTATILNYGNPINTIKYTLTIGFSHISSQIHNFPVYFTKDRCQDDKVWKTIDPNIRQLSMGFGLNVQDEKSSFIYELYRNNIISEKKFSFELNEELYTTFGSFDESKEKYQKRFISEIPSDETKWGLYVNRFTINKKNYDIEKYAIINSGIDLMFKSYDIFQMFKLYLQNSDKYKNICRETIYKSSITMECTISIEEMVETITLNIANEIAFDVPLKKFFSYLNSKKVWMKSVYYDITNNSKYIEVGKGFLDMFNFVEFDFDRRTVEFCSKEIEFRNESLGIFTLSNRKRGRIICNILTIIINVFSIGHIVMTKFISKSFEQNI